MAISRDNINLLRHNLPLLTEEICIITHTPPKEINPVTKGIDKFAPLIRESELISTKPLITLLTSYEFDDNMLAMKSDIVDIILKVSSMEIKTLNITIIEHTENKDLVLELILLIKLPDEIFILMFLFLYLPTLEKSPIKTAIVIFVMVIDINIIKPIDTLLYRRREIIPIIKDGPLQKQ